MEYVDILNRMSRGTRAHLKRIARLRGYVLNDKGIAKEGTVISTDWQRIHDILFNLSCASEQVDTHP